jgi:hypothetical protein
MMTIGSVLLVIRPRQQGHVVDHVYKDMWQITSRRTCGRPYQQTMSTRTCGRPLQQATIAKDMWWTMSAYHVSKYTWNNQMMTSVKRKLACSMTTSDVSKLRHSGRIASEVSPPRNIKSPKVPKDEGLKSLSVVDLRYIGS